MPPPVPARPAIRLNAPGWEVAICDILFFQSQKGRWFYESAQPELVRQIARPDHFSERICTLLESLPSSIPNR